MRLATLLMVMMTFPSLAIAASVDWKLYGGAKFTADNSYCFYEERGLTRPKSGFVHVWTKCLPQKEMDELPTDKPYSRAYIDMSASRVAHFYKPPVLAVERMTSDQVMTTIMYETLADVGDLKPQAQIFYELDCGQRKMRELTILVGDRTSRDAPSEWHEVPPEGNAATLLGLLCPR
jgi:hypothetical protein